MGRSGGARGAQAAERARHGAVRQLPATEQPGNSFRYLYWRLSEKRFQQLCAAVVRLKFDGVQCLPVGMADRGVDMKTVRGEAIVFQVKWSSKLEQDPVGWLKDAIHGERSNIERLVHEHNVERYILITSVAGTTTADRRGSQQRLESVLAEFSDDFGIPVECWWQSDLDAEIDAAPDALKWAYEDMLAGTDAVRCLMFGSQTESASRPMRETLLRVMRVQWDQDLAVKFARTDMDRIKLSDVFVDVATDLPPAAAEMRGTPIVPGAVARLCLTDRSVLLLGAPGQGKSTAAQFLCQVHRAQILELPFGGPLTLERARLPIRVDLRDYAAWVLGRDPFGEDDGNRRRPRAKQARSLELFLVDLCRAASGGRSVSVEEVQDLFDRYPTLLVLDGLDEVANPDLRRQVVAEIDMLAGRTEPVGDRRLLQIVVTARPNASGLAEPDQRHFARGRLLPLDAALQSAYVSKWAEAHGIDGADRTRLHRIFRERTAYDHVAQLADVPMQLTILLHLIHRRGSAVPVERTQLYRAYMDTLMDREVERDLIRRDAVEKVQQVTAFLGWHLQSGAEERQSAGSISRRNLPLTVQIYLARIGESGTEVESLIGAATERFWALTSKMDGEFEFVVQPVREYFAAKYLAEWGGSDDEIDGREPLLKDVVLQELLKRGYWFNTLRFYAGFASPNELPTLRDGISAALVERTRPLQQRLGAWTILADGVFANRSRLQHAVVVALADELTLSLVGRFDGPSTRFPRLPAAAGGDDMAEVLLEAIELEPDSPSSTHRVRVLRDLTSCDPERFAAWLADHLTRDQSAAAERHWLCIGAAYGPTELPASTVDVLRLESGAASAAALQIGVRASPDSDQANQMLQHVLDGRASDLSAPLNSEAGALLTAMRPYWFQSGQEPRARTAHHFDDADPTARITAWRTLIALRPEYERLRAAARSTRAAVKGTTERWQGPARELARMHGRSWLATEIALTGASALGVVPSGSIVPGGEPLGDSGDYGNLVIEIARGPAQAWWNRTFDAYPDDLSRLTWALAVLTSAPPAEVSRQHSHLDEILQRLDDDSFAALADSSSRIAASRLPRRLPRRDSDEHSESPRLALLLAHHTDNDSLDRLSNADLLETAGPTAGFWPVANAVLHRIRRRPDDLLLAAAERLGERHGAGIRLDKAQLGTDTVATLLANSSQFPSALVAQAEAERAAAMPVPMLRSHAIAEFWTEDVPIL